MDNANLNKKLSNQRIRASEPKTDAAPVSLWRHMRIHYDAIALCVEWKMKVLRHSAFILWRVSL